jgi:hypothetical protein
MTRIKVTLNVKTTKMKKNNKVVPALMHHAMKTNGEAEVYLHPFLISALDGSEWPVSCLGRFNFAERAPVAHWIGGWMGSRFCLDVMAKIRISATARN